jgi:hypothetical protein
MMRRAAALLLLAVSAIACGDDSTTPTNPSQPGTFVISPQSDFLTIGTAVTLQASLTDSGGTARVVAADWSTLDGRIAAIDRSGRLTALASGTTTVRAVFEQQTATLEVRVAPDFAGAWSGRARVTACSHPTPSVCQVDYAVGTQYITRVTLVQSRDQVVGTLYVPYPASLTPIPPLVVDGTLSGRIDLGGRLPMTGTLVGPGPSSPAAGTIADWRTEIDTTQPVLRGSYTEVTTTGGTSSISWEFIGLTRGT